MRGSELENRVRKILQLFNSILDPLGPAKDPAFAAEYLKAVLEDGDQEELMLALHRMSEAFGGVQKLAGRAKLNANTLYRTLSPKGNPELKSLRAVLRAMGMQLTVRPLRKRVA